jgi:membrane-associated phospholipid phosphatase
LVVEGAARLSELVPGWAERWDMQDSATRSVPGDHASALLIWAMFISLLARNWRLLLAWTMAAVFMLPRLMAGAHWGSDAVVGGLFLALLGLVWPCFTPFACKASEWLEKEPCRSLACVPSCRR